MHLTLAARVRRCVNIGDRRHGASGRERGPMTTSGPIRVDRPFEDIAELLSLRPGDWLVPFLRIAAHAGEAMAGRTLHSPARPGSRRISIELSNPEPGDRMSEMVVPIRWRTSGFDWVTPAYAGRLVLRRVSARSSEIVLDGSYVLPRGVTDGALAAVTELAIHVTVSTLLRSLAVAVEEQARETG